MTNEAPRGGSSCALQGCLFGSVALFVVLLLIMVYLALYRFREETGTVEPAPTVGAVVPTAIEGRLLTVPLRPSGVSTGDAFQVHAAALHSSDREGLDRRSRHA